MAEFAQTLTGAEGLLNERPLRTTLTDAEIGRMAEFCCAEKHAEDQAFTLEGAVEDQAFTRSIAEKLKSAGVEFGMSYPLGSKSPYGLSDPQLAKSGDYPEEELHAMRAALALATSPRWPSC